MTSITTKPGSTQLEAAATCRLFDNWFDPIETEVRARARGFIEELLRSELDEGAGTAALWTKSDCDYRDNTPLVFFSSRYHLGPGVPLDR